MTRGVLYITWGNRCDTVLKRSIDSLKESNPSLPYHVHNVEDGSLLSKPSMYDWSPYDDTLYLDADTIVCGPMDYGFEQSRWHDLAVAICECPWACRYPSMRDDVVEYNTGVIFFRKSVSNRQLFRRWSQLVYELDSSIQFTGKEGEPATMHYNDQCGFAAAIDDLRINPFVLPLNWNLRPLWHKRWFGSVRVWHDYMEPPANISDRQPMELFSIE